MEGQTPQVYWVRPSLRELKAMGSKCTGPGQHESGSAVVWDGSQWLSRRCCETVCVFGWMDLLNPGCSLRPFLLGHLVSPDPGALAGEARAGEYEM